METSVERKWYQNLNKSPLTPPNWVFPVVWSVLYMTIAVSGVMYFTSGKTSTIATTFFITQLVLNLSWSPAFFKYRRIGLSLAICGLMWIFILLTIIQFKQVSPITGYLLLPYLAWVSLAFYLNGYIWIKN